MSVEEQVKEAIIKNIDVAVDGSELTDGTQLEDIGVNSINFIRMVIQLECIYNVQFDIDMLGVDSYDVVGNLISYVQELVGETKVNN